MDLDPRTEKPQSRTWNTAYPKRGPQGKDLCASGACLRTEKPSPLGAYLAVGRRLSRSARFISAFPGADVSSWAGSGAHCGAGEYRRSLSLRGLGKYSHW